MKKIIFIALVICSAAVKAQYKKPFFNTLSVESGLPEANILSSLQDKLGYMWFGTQNGLVRYDGYQLKPYPMLTDEGIPSMINTVNYLYEDSKGKLWAFAYQEGLYKYDRSKDIFVKVPLNKEFGDKLKKVNFFRRWIEDKEHTNIHWFFTVNSVENKNHIYMYDEIQNTYEDFSSLGKDNHFVPWFKGADIAQDANGKTWIVADTLLSYFDWSTRSFQPFFVLPSDSTKKYYFSVLIPDPADMDLLWLNTYIPGESDYTRKFLQFNIKTKKYKIFTAENLHPRHNAPDKYLKIFIDSLKRVWIATDQDVSLYNRETGNFSNFNLNVLSSNDRNNYISCLASDASGNVWIGGTFKNLIYLNTKTGENMLTNTGDPGSLPENNFINKLFYDRTGSLWVNIPFSGIAYLDRQRSFFTTTTIVPSFVPKDKKIGTTQYGIQGNAGDSILYITDTASFVAWNIHKNSFTKIDLADKTLYADINIVEPDKDNSIWIGTYEHGLLNYNFSSKKIKKYLSVKNDSTTISSNVIVEIITDKEGILWIGTYDKGLCSFNKQTNTFTRYPYIQNDGTIVSHDSLDDVSVQCLLLDKEGILWIGTNGGSLNRFNTKTGKFTSFLNYKNGFTCVISLLEDSHGRLWAGTYQSGLFLVDKKTGDLTRYTEKDGLMHTTVIGIKEDNEGNIWAATLRGLSKFDPGTKHFTNYPLSLSLLSFTPSSFAVERDGLIHISTKNGLVSFNPGLMKASIIPPAVIIESVTYHNASNKDSTIFVDGRTQIKLNYNENRISFKYVGLHYENAILNQYAYKLDGYDKDWISAETQRSVTYSNLSPGTYTFHVKASNSDGIWNETGTSFMIIISPPWWKTWWAYCLYVLLAGGSIWAFVQYRSKALRKENLVLEQKVDHRTSQLQQSLQDLKATQSQLIQSEKMASLGELTAGIAHEIQNPLNFVNNFSEVSNELIVEMNDELNKGAIDEAKAIANDIKQNLEKINHHGKRADAIVKGMLQHSRSSSSIKEPTDINKLADEYLRLAYHGLRAKDKSFNATLKTDFDESIGNINIIPQDIGRVILNLITNAFYVVNEKALSAVATPTAAKYEPTVSISTKKTNNKVEIKVADNGNGIPKKVLDKIFQPFFTTKPTGQGTGLGLSLSYDIVKAHAGELKVETKEGDGATFIIILPSA